MGISSKGSLNEFEPCCITYEVIYMPQNNTEAYIHHENFEGKNI